MPMYWETEEHGRFRDQVRRFTEQAVMPHLDGWEAEGRLPVSLHQQAAEAGILQIGFPEAYGGIEVPDGFYELIVIEELCRAGSGGLIASLLSLGIGLPPIVALGSEALKARVLPPVLRGDAVSALAITEPGGGSDVANLQTRARLQDDHYVLDGSKTFITSGMRADWLTVAARTGPAGMHGITLFAVPGDAPGLDRSALDKMGWRCSDTATLYFQNCRVPADCVIGQVNAGFLGIMRNFNNERLALAAQAVGLAQCAYDEALGWARERETFGKPLIQRQVIRHRLVDMLCSPPFVPNGPASTNWFGAVVRARPRLPNCACSKMAPPRCSNRWLARRCRFLVAPVISRAAAPSAFSARPKCCPSAAGPARS